jgi:hypothetical protein
MEGRKEKKEKESGMHHLSCSYHGMHMSACSYPKKKGSGVGC